MVWDRDESSRWPKAAGMEQFSSHLYSIYLKGRFLERIPQMCSLEYKMNSVVFSMWPKEEREEIAIKARTEKIYANCLIALTCLILLALFLLASSVRMFAWDCLWFSAGWLVIRDFFPNSFPLTRSLPARAFRFWSSDISEWYTPIFQKIEAIARVILEFEDREEIYGLGYKDIIDRANGCLVALVADIKAKESELKTIASRRGRSACRRFIARLNAKFDGNYQSLLVARMVHPWCNHRAYFFEDDFACCAKCEEVSTASV